MRMILTYILVAAVLAVPGCAFVCVWGDGNVTDVNLFDMSYRAGLPKEPVSLADQVIPKPALKRFALPDKPVWLTDLPLTKPTTRPATVPVD